MEEKYALRGTEFIIRDYDRQKPFSSFLPGLAGVKGIPMWAYYTNRGQAMASFGIHNKDNAMMEFSPAVTEYETVQLKGFRSFLRMDGRFVEPFLRQEEGVSRVMALRRNSLSITEERPGLRTRVDYFILPEEDIGALVRRVRLENTGEQPLSLELLDGMPQVIPYGVGNSSYKEMANLMRSWADIVNLEENAPIYKMRASGGDSAEVTEINGGWYYFALLDGQRLPVVYDRDLIFGSELSLMEPAVFARGGLAAVTEQSPCFANKVPCAFAAARRVLAPGESMELTAFAGYAASPAFLNQKALALAAPGRVEEKLARAQAIVDELTADVRTHTADGRFDQYVEQCYLDNFLRGGYPFLFGRGEDRKVVHLFSRKHGDPERDYNFFSIAGEYYSQGNGNYRDVCQNRRLDVSLHPEVGEFNVLNFFSLVQLDGFNPLEIRPSTFAVRDLPAAERLLAEFLPAGAEPVRRVLEQPFTPGQITRAVAENGLVLSGDPEELVTGLLALCDQRFEAGFGEGYWSDHFDYDLDLIEDYLSVWPDKKQALLFEDRRYRYYNSAAVVRPRSETYVLGAKGPRQYGALRESAVKLALPGFDPKGTNWLLDANGQPVVTNLFEKLLTLAVNKFAQLDSEGLGVELEGGKPGWNDAMNGLPGLFGSSMAETLELRRVVRFLREALAQRAGDEPLPLLRELSRFMEKVYAGLTEESDRFARWQRVAGEREAFRAQIEPGVSGETEPVTQARLEEILSAFAAALEDAVTRALAIGGGVMPTFFTYEAAQWSPVLDENGQPVISPYGLPAVTVSAFRRKDLPPFLEGPARYLSSCGPEDRAAAADMAARVKASPLYDEKLGMYKTSASLEGESMEIGRIRAFTPGWLERESVFLHMEYKYFVGLLHAGLYEQFFAAIGDALIPNQDPAVYGRSVLENSSFIASSANPDPAVHGRGFQARLSGSAIESLAMWKGMFVGEGGFGLQDGALCYRFAPVLSGAMFDEQGEAAFTLCGSCAVTYHNLSRGNTFGEGGVRVRALTVETAQGPVTVEGDTLSAQTAVALRDHQIRRIDVSLG